MKYFVVLLFVSGCFCLDNGLARTPPMGWMTWERFRCTVDCDANPENCISEDLILSTAINMKRLGFLSFGYKYIIIDDCWLNKSRTSDGRLIPDPRRFPNGMGYIGDVLHYLGFQFGLYEDFGTLTCGGYPGSLNYMEQDVKTFVGWKVDYIKLDGCYSDTKIQPTGYKQYEELLNKSGRPIVFSCSWPAYRSVNGINKTDLDLLINNCNLWRMYDDIDDSWSSVLGIINFYKANQNNFTSWGGPGHWNDPDMLIIGNFGLNYDQQRVQMGMWAIFAGPLIMSNDLRNISTESVALLQNQHIIDINQDLMGKPGWFLFSKNDVQVWRRDLSNGASVVAVLNTGTIKASFFVAMKDVGYNDPTKVYVISDAFTMADKKVVHYDSVINFELNPTGIEMLNVHE